MQKKRIDVFYTINFVIWLVVFGSGMSALETGRLPLFVLAAFYSFFAALFIGRFVKRRSLVYIAVLVAIPFSAVTVALVDPGNSLKLSGSASVYAAVLIPYFYYVNFIKRKLTPPPKSVESAESGELDERFIRVSKWLIPLTVFCLAVLIILVLLRRW